MIVFLLLDEYINRKVRVAPVLIPGPQRGTYRLVWSQSRHNLTPVPPRAALFSTGGELSDHSRSSKAETFPSQQTRYRGASDSLSLTPYAFRRGIGADRVSANDALSVEQRIPHQHRHRQRFPWLEK